jgi:hypothetical protein
MGVKISNPPSFLDIEYSSRGDLPLVQRKRNNISLPDQRHILDPEKHYHGHLLRSLPPRSVTDILSTAQTSRRSSFCDIRSSDLIIYFAKYWHLAVIPP